MPTIWTILLLSSLTASMLTGRGAETATALMDSGDEAVKLLLTLIASMTLWSGMMEILNASGDVARLGGLFRRCARPLFPGLKDEACWSAMSMNLSANILGLGNAATPAGIEAARLLTAQGEAGMKALSVLLVLDNASLQLMPSTVISMRQAAGAVNPADVWFPTLLVSGVSMLSALAMLLLLQRGGNMIGRIFRHGDGRGGRTYHTQGRDQVR